MNLSDINIYRMTHLENIEHILAYGITSKKSEYSNPNFINIGDVSLINNRSTKTVIIDNGTFPHQIFSSIVLGDYVPFYFGKKMPMLYVIQTGGNFVENPTIPENIIYLRCSLQSVLETTTNYYFTDGHATDNLTSFYDSSKINEIENIIDWKAVDAPFWGGEENLNIKRKKQAEFLVGVDIPIKCVNGFGCYNDNAKQNLIQLGVESDMIRIIPNEYY